VEIGTDWKMSVIMNKSNQIKWKQGHLFSNDTFFHILFCFISERDIGVTEESECMGGLLLHLVESYEGEDTDTDEDEEIGGINKLFKYILI
jgi:hypothetical protein